MLEANLSTLFYTLGTSKAMQISLNKFNLITQAARPGFKFQLSFFFSHSVTNRRLVSKAHASPVHAYSTWNLQKFSEKLAWIS